MTAVFRENALIFRILKNIILLPCIFLLFSFRIAPAIAGWSSLVARRAHNPKVVGSNPAPATSLKSYTIIKAPVGVFCFIEIIKVGLVPIFYIYAGTKWLMLK